MRQFLSMTMLFCSPFLSSCHLSALLIDGSVSLPLRPVPYMVLCVLALAADTLKAGCRGAEVPAVGPIPVCLCVYVNWRWTGRGLKAGQEGTDRMPCLIWTGACAGGIAGRR